MLAEEEVEGDDKFKVDERNSKERSEPRIIFNNILTNREHALSLPTRIIFFSCFVWHRSVPQTFKV